MKLSVLLAASVMLTSGSATSYALDPFSKLNRIIPPQVRKQIPKSVPIPGGRRTTGGGSGSAAAAIIVTVTAVGVLMALEQQQRANQGGGSSSGGKSGVKSSGAGKPTPSQPLSRRDVERETWSRIQARLNELGFDAGQVDGRPGPKTMGALESFQASIGYEMTGQLTPEQTALLYASSTDAPEVGEAEITTTVIGTAEPTAPPDGADEPLDDLVVTPPVASSDGAGAVSPVSATLSPSGTVARRATAPDSTVMGIRPLTELSAAETSLDENYDACERTGSTLVCTSTREGGVKDTLVVGYSRDGTREVIHTLSRELNFERPVPRAGILGQLSDVYSDLIFVPEMTLASNRDCVSRATAFQESRFEELLTWARSGDAATGSISALAEACDFYYTIDVPDGEQLQRVSITLFTGAPIRQAQLATPEGNGDAPQIRF